MTTKKHIAVAGIMILAATNIMAQVHKCVDGNGKVTYSDALCASGSNSSDISTTHNTMDSSGLRATAARYAEEDRKQAVAAMLASPPPECKFRYVLNNAQSKASAEEAKRECVANKFAAMDGKFLSTTAQTQHNERLNAQIDAGRQRALTSAVQQNTHSLNQNTRAIESVTRELRWGQR